MDKSLLRTKIKKKLGNLTQEDISNKSNIILEKIINSAEIYNNNIFMVFESIQKEFLTQGLIEFLLKNKKKVLIPKVIDDKEMIAIDLETKQEFKGNIDIAYIPGIVFGFDYNRIGRGKGYYDRFLAKNNIRTKIGICFDIQLIDSIPSEIHDQKMSIIITESFTM